MREICLDTETTGLGHADRICALGMVELAFGRPTGSEVLLYFNPGRPSIPDALRIHGLADAALARKPTFASQAERIAAHLTGARVVAHNASFDVRMLNHEFEIAGLAFRIAMADAVDTLALARKKYPRLRNDLDSLLTREGIVFATERRHGALYDAKCLALLYPALAVQQVGMELQPALPVAAPEPRPNPRPPFRSRLKPGDLERHRELIQGFGKRSVWGDYLGKGKGKTKGA